MTEHEAAALHAGLSSPRVPWHPQFLADQLTLSEPGGGADYPLHITTGPPPGFSDLPTALTCYPTLET